MDEEINLLVVVTVAGGQAGNLTHMLNHNHYGFTEIASQVSLLEQSFTSLLVGTQQSRLKSLQELVRECCPVRIQYVPARLEPGSTAPPLMIEALLGGASLFAVEVEQFIQI